MSLALSPKTHAAFFDKTQEADYSAKPGAIFAGRTVIAEEEKVYVEITYDTKPFKEVPTCLRNLLSCYNQGKSLLTYHLYKKRGVAPIVIGSPFHNNMKTVTSLDEGNDIYRPFLLTNTKSKQKSLVLTATDSHYYTMTFDKEKAVVHLQKEEIDSNPNKKIRVVTKGNIKRFNLQNSQIAIKKLLKTLLN